MSPLALKAMLESALEKGAEGATIADVEAKLASGDALLWLGERGALVTSLHETEDGRFVHVWLGAGDMEEIVSMEPGVSAWARARQCKSARINGRKGWDRVFKSRGFIRVGEELVKYYV